MSSNENSNKVTQTSNEVTNGDIVGRDKKVFNQSGAIINIFPSGPLNTEKLIDFLVAYGYNEDFIRSIFQLKERGIHHISSIDQNLSFLEVLQGSTLNAASDEIQKEYDNIVLGDKMESNAETVKYKILEAATCVNKLEFKKAHQLLDDSLGIINPTHNLYNFIYKEYLITGFIWYSKQNDTNGLKSLLRKRSEIRLEENSGTDYIISMIFQEIFSRDTELEGLREVVSRLDKIYTSVNDSIKPAMANSLGLAYRRLGERTGIHNLEKAIGIFQEGLNLNKANKKIEIELKDQMAAAHIRIFEFNKEAEQLDTAETLLKDCLKLLAGPMDPRDYRLKPRVLNNIGNIYKQKILIFKEITSASKAIAYYEEAEQYWNEKEANYDWALLRKNMAETKYALGMLTNDTEILLEALKDSMQSTQYRNLKNSPYQWGKSVKIVFSLVILLNEQKSIKLIPKSSRRTILSYVSSVISNDTKWSENISAEFVQNARQAQVLLL